MELKNLTKALIAVQSKLKPVERNKFNPHFKYHYADLETVWSSVQPLLEKNGFAISQVIIAGPCLQTSLLHESGESIVSQYPLNPAKPNDPQSLAATVSYARRISLCAILGVVAEDDDDGTNAASASPEAQKPHLEASGAIPEARKSGFATISEPQSKRLFAIAMSKGWTKEGFSSALATFGYANSKDIKPEKYEQIVKFFEIAPKDDAQE